MEKKKEYTNAATTMLHDSLEAGALEAFPGGVRGFLIGVGANLHTVIFVTLRRNNEGREFFLLQVRGEAHGVGLAAQRGDLQSVRIRGNRRRADGLSALASCRGRDGTGRWSGHRPRWLQIVVRRRRLAGIVETPVGVGLGVNLGCGIGIAARFVRTLRGGLGFGSHRSGL